MFCIATISTQIRHEGFLVTATATDFLRAFDAEGNHNIVAIADGKPLEGRTFPPGQWQEMQDWIDARNGKAALYFSVNEPADDAPDTKLARKHIKRVRAAYVDFDGDDRQALLERALGDPCNDDLVPSIVVDSGKGYWAYWLLKDDATQGELEAQNRALVARLGGDPASVDAARIARLPGTINLKNGRTTSVVQQVPFRYSLDELSAWCPRGAARELSSAQEPLVDWDQPEAVMRATAWLLQDAPLSNEGEQGDKTAFGTAARLKDFGVSAERALAMMLDH
jgi:hypothetical protein